MRGHSRASGEPAKAQRRKAGARKSRIKTKAVNPRNSSAAREETKVARLTRERGEALQQQRATAEVLKVISRSSVHLQQVLDMLVETVARLCHADHALMFRWRDDVYRLIASRGLSHEAKEFFLRNPFAPGAGTLAGRVALERRVIHLTDVLRDPKYTHSAPKISGARTSLGIPLLRDDALIGVFVAARTRVYPFTTKEIELATTFADQAVIAIENTRLIAELRQRKDQLGRSVAELQRERNNKLMNLEAMAASISHEVKQPLASIAMHGGAALRFLGHVPPNVEEIRSSLNWMISDSHRANQVFDNIRTLFGKGDVGYEPIDMNELIRHVLSTVQRDLDDHGITTSLRLSEDLPKVAGHKGQLEEVLLNLVRNAIEAMQTDKNDHRVLQVSSDPGGDKIIVAVEDSGPGIDPDQAAKIFDAFVTTKSQGMGLGLAICRMIIVRHSGELTASSAKPRGSIFRISLPILAATR
jgi:signal transduction histidine kinase